MFVLNALCALCAQNGVCKIVSKNGQEGSRTLTTLRSADFKSAVYAIPPLALYAWWITIPTHWYITKDINDFDIYLRRALGSGYSPYKHACAFGVHFCRKNGGDERILEAAAYSQSRNPASAFFIAGEPL